MGYDRYPRGTDEDRDNYGRRDTQDYGRDYGSGRSGGYSSARDYAAAGSFGQDRDDERGGYGRGSGSSYGERDRGYGRSQYGQSQYGQSDYGQREYGNAGYARGGDDGDRQGYGRADYGHDNRYGGQYGSRYGAGSGGDRSRYGQQPYGRDDDRGFGGGQSRYARSDEYHGSYASDGHRFEDVGSRRHADDDNYRGGNRAGNNDRGRPQGYDYDDRGFLARAGDEVRSWFGDEDAERRREMDSRYDERYYNQQQHHRDSDYGSWRSGQIAALDRDYDEYRQENRAKFENEFSNWRSNRQTQRQSLDKVQEHAEVVGSDGSHVGTVDKVRGDRIVLTKNDSDAGGRHHSVPSSWISSVEDKKVTLSKTADEAKKHWRDEEQNQALFRTDDANRTTPAGQTNYGGSSSYAGASSSGQSGYGGQSTYGSSQSTAGGSADQGSTDLNKSFSGTYEDGKKS